MSLSIGFLVFPGAQPLDLVGPYEVFASLPGTNLHLAWKDRAPLVSASGLTLTPTTTFAECPALDIVCVPGGSGVNALLKDEETLAFLRGRAKSARFVTSVCTGALVLGAAGLLKGRHATTYWNAREFLPAFGAIPAPGRMVRDGNVVTAGGVTAGIDFALALVAELAGREVAETIQLCLEYAPAPPFAAGTPEQAPADVLAKARLRQEPSHSERRKIIDGL